MSLGISACELEQEFFSGPELFASFLKLKFTGATGVIEIDPTTGSRTTQTSTFIIKNIVPQEPNPNGLVHFKVRRFAQRLQSLFLYGQKSTRVKSHLSLLLVMTSKRR